MKKLILYGIYLFLIIITVIGCSSSELPATTTSEMPSNSISNSSPSASPSDTPFDQSGEEINRVDLLYFHPKRRCATCLSLETLTKAFLEDNYKEQLVNGTITFTSYELDDENNAELVKKYGVISSQLFINVIVNGEDNIQHIDQIWLPQVYNDAETFNSYLDGIISKSLEEIK